MIAHMIQNKTSLPQDKIRAEVGAAPIIIEALFRSVTYIRWLLRLALRLELPEHGDMIVGMLKCNNGSSHMA